MFNRDFFEKFPTRSFDRTRIRVVRVSNFDSWFGYEAPIKTRGRDRLSKSTPLLACGKILRLSHCPFVLGKLRDISMIFELNFYRVSWWNINCQMETPLSHMQKTLSCIAIDVIILPPFLHKSIQKIKYRWRWDPWI